MAEAAQPRTPTPTSRTLRRNDADAANQSPTALGALTPPPSDKKARSSFSVKPPLGSPSKSQNQNDNHITKKGNAHNGNTTIPSPEQVQAMTESQLRDMLNDLLPSLGEARMELAHTKLQYQLLAFETHEAAERAEVEHDMTRKEVEILKAGSPVIQNRAILMPDPRSTMAQLQRQLEAAIHHVEELETDNMALDYRLRDAKRIIKCLDGRASELADHNQLLRERIRSNREHLNTMRATGLLRSAPVSPKQFSPKARNQSGPSNANGTDHHVVPPRSRRNGLDVARQKFNIPPTPLSHAATSTAPGSARPADPNDPFGALLIAGEVLNAEQQRASMPNTPSPVRTMRWHPRANGHSRGAMSLNSLPVVPRSKLYSPPNVAPPMVGRHRRDSNSSSTLSESSAEEEAAATKVQLGLGERDEALTEDDLPASQASQAASDLLRRFPGPSSSQESLRKASGSGSGSGNWNGNGNGNGNGSRDGSGLVKTRPTGKASMGNKRAYENSNQDESKAKKLRGAKGVGLGIGMWAQGR